MKSHPIVDHVHMREFILAGNATVTLVSKSTGTRYTYKVRHKEDNAPWFVSVMYGSDNEHQFAYMGCIYKDGQYRHGRKSKLSETDVREKAFAWVWANLNDKKRIPDSLEVWHEGKCGRCGRKLTVPESIERGIGPECASRMGG